MSRIAEEVLRARARDLAQVDDRDERQGFPLTLFARGGSMFAVRIEEVAGAGTLKHLSPIPGAPPWMAGAVLHRGDVLTLVDLPVLWGVEMRGIADMPSYVVISDGRARIGLLVEDLRGVHEVEQAPRPWKGAPRAGVHEVTSYRNQPVMVLSAATLLTDPRLVG